MAQDLYNISVPKDLKNKLKKKAKDLNIPITRLAAVAIQAGLDKNVGAKIGLEDTISALAASKSVVVDEKQKQVELEKKKKKYGDTLKAA